MTSRDRIVESARAEERTAGGVSEPLAKNIATLMERRSREMSMAPATERIAASVASFLGSMWSVAFHAVVFGLWIVANLGLLPGVSPCDPSLVVLAMIASVEAIFLTTFVLVNQNRLARIEEERSELALQIALLSEREVSAVVEIATDIARRLEIPVDADVAELSEETMPDAVLDEIRRRKPEPL